MSKPGGKFGPVKRQHGRVAGLDALLDRIASDCQHVTKIVPGRFGRKRGKTAARFKVQYVTNEPATGLKCMYTNAGSWQEVFLVCTDAEKAQAWVEANC
ncbi:MAG: DUF2103 domain-containing protein [Planctomycetota bacterium]